MIIFRFVSQMFNFLTYIPNNTLHPGPDPSAPEVLGVSSFLFCLRGEPGYRCVRDSACGAGPAGRGGCGGVLLSLLLPHSDSSVKVCCCHHLCCLSKVSL